MLRAISDYAKAADLGILDMQFEFNSNEIQDDESLPDNIPDGIKAALVQFMHTRRNLQQWRGTLENGRGFRKGQPPG